MLNADYLFVTCIFIRAYSCIRGQIKNAPFVQEHFFLISRAAEKYVDVIFFDLHFTPLFAMVGFSND